MREKFEFRNVSERDFRMEMGKSTRGVVMLQQSRKYSVAYLLKMVV